MASAHVTTMNHTNVIFGSMWVTKYFFKHEDIMEKLPACHEYHDSLEGQDLTVNSTLRCVRQRKKMFLQIGRATFHTVICVSTIAWGINLNQPVNIREMVLNPSEKFSL